MFTATTLFGIVLVLIIAVSLIILLIRKPHIPLPFSFEGKSSKSKEEEVQTLSKTCPHYFGYLSDFPKDTPIPKECGGCTKVVDCQVGLETLRTLFRKEETPREEPSEQVEAPKPKTTTPESLHARPPECSHFFGYLKGIPKNTPIPDECFGCQKMVECLYYSAASE